MCYLIAKNKNVHGCIALKTRHGSHLVEMKRRMNQQVASKGVQVVTISRPREQKMEWNDSILEELCQSFGGNPGYGWRSHCRKYALYDIEDMHHSCGWVRILGGKLLEVHKKNCSSLREIVV